MISQAENYHSDLKQAVELLFATGGKRIRPTIILLIGKLLHSDRAKRITLAAAIELLHTATLVHDDLIDGALLRRGAPTLNSKWSPAATVLAGDFMFSCAANLAAQTDSIQVMQLFSQTLITIVNGEISQMLNDKGTIDRAEYYSRIYAKTASLFETSAKSAALISLADSTIVEHFRIFGYALGMSFQIVDDVLDYIGSETNLGKPVGGDLRQGLITAPLLFFAENSLYFPEIQPFIEGKYREDKSAIDTLVSKIANSEAIEQSLKEASHFALQAKESLGFLSDTPEKKALSEIADFIVQRNQ